MINNTGLLQDLFSQGHIALENGAFLSTIPDEMPAKWDFERIEGMLLGLAVGDALGNTSESMSPGQRRAFHGEIRDYLPNLYADFRKVGLPSDDSQMAFWTLEQLLEDDGLVPDHLAARFTWNPIYGIGNTVRGFIRAYKDQGKSWVQAGQPSAGNGALMRIAPVVIPHLRQPSPALWADAALAGMITHNDRASNACCIAFISILWQCLRLDHVPEPIWWVDKFVEVASQLEGDTRYATRNNGIDYVGSLWQFVDREVRRAIAEGWTTLEACERWHSGAYLLETMPCVLYILAQYAGSPEEAIVRAVNDTQDNDTVAAIVGAVVGALHGRAGIPARWITPLIGRTGSDDDWHIFELIEAAKQTFWQADPPLVPAGVDAVLRFLPIFEQPGFKPGEWFAPAGAFPYFNYSAEVLDFLTALSSHGFIQPFQWMAWEEGKQLVNNPALLQKVGMQTLRKLLTLHVRADRFSEGHLAHIFDTGQMTAILKRIETLHRQKAAW